MVNVRNPFRRQDSVDATTAPELHRNASDDLVKTPTDEKEAYNGDVKATDPADYSPDQLEDKNVLANGKERPIEVRRSHPAFTSFPRY